MKPDLKKQKLSNIEYYSDSLPIQWVAAWPGTPKTADILAERHMTITLETHVKAQSRCKKMTFLTCFNQTVNNS
jgi:hypothetical protein